jgi:hypothetical protein
MENDDVLVDRVWQPGPWFGGYRAYVLGTRIESFGLSAEEAIAKAEELVALRRRRPGEFEQGGTL